MIIFIVTQGIYLYIFFSDLKNKLLLNKAVQNLFDFLKNNFDVSSDEPVKEWIFDVFIDQDDILLGVILALLKIYINLKEDSFS